MSQISNQAIQTEIRNNGITAELSTSTIASTLTLTCGIIQILMGICRFKFLADYFSDALISGFVCGAAIHTIVSQCSKLFGVKTKVHSSNFSAFLNLQELALKYEDFKWQTISLSCFSLAFLMVGKSLVVPFIRRRLHFLFPCELLLILLTTCFSYIFSWNKTMEIVGSIPKGFPEPQPVELWLVPYCVPHALAICCVTVALHFSMVKLFANKFQYSVSLSHELYAIGFSSMASGFFPTYPTSTALARTVVLVESGARTQLASGFSALLVLFVILFVGPLFEPLPQCVLAAIIIVSLKSVFLNFKSIGCLWRADKFDLIIWSVSFVGTLFTNVIIGLGIGVLTSIFTLIIRIQWPQCSHKMYENGRICVFRFDSPLLFVNCYRFSGLVHEALDKWSTVGCRLNEQSDSDPAFVFDCAAMTRLDTMGLQTLRQSCSIIEQHGLRVQLVNVNANILDFLESADLGAHIVDVPRTDVHNQFSAFI